jgi:hypothetical protein
MNRNRHALNLYQTTRSLMDSMFAANCSSRRVMPPIRGIMADQRDISDGSQTLRP